MSADRVESRNEYCPSTVTTRESAVVAFAAASPVALVTPRTVALVALFGAGLVVTDRFVAPAKPRWAKATD